MIGLNCVWPSHVLPDRVWFARWNWRGRGTVFLTDRRPHLVVNLALALACRACWAAGSAVRPYQAGAVAPKEPKSKSDNEDDEV